jgi:hypothetical protein
MVKPILIPKYLNNVLVIDTFSDRHYGFLPRIAAISRAV